MTAPTNGSGGELLPCPFCGSDELSYGHSSPGFTNEHNGIVQCHNCDSYMLGAHEIDAIAAWNTRTPPAQVGAATDSGEGVRYETDDRGLFCKHCGLTALRHHTHVGKAGLYCAASPTKPVAAADTPPDELARMQLLADVELHLQSCRVFLTSREKMHPCGVEIHDELLAQVTAAIEENGRV